MTLEFEWDPAKARSNFRKHKVTFEEASTVFADLYSVTAADPDHTTNEDRFLIIGFSRNNRLLLVSFAERRSRIRIISARTLTPRERNQYEET